MRRGHDLQVRFLSFLKNRRWTPLLTWLFIGVGAIAALGILVWQADNSIDRDPQSRFEIEVTSAEQAAAWMDRRLEDTWIALGVLKTNIQLTSLLTQESEGERWDMQVLDVRLPVALVLDQAAKVLETQCKSEDYAVQILWVKESSSLWVADLWVDGFLTHRVLFRETPKIREPAIQGPRQPQIALIVDDLGNMYNPIRSLFKMKAPFTVSIFPHCPFSKKIAQEAHSRGLEIMLHLPMEPRGYPGKNPGIGALLVSMNNPQMEHVLTGDIDDVPHVKGVNNHMGSRFTEDRERMEKVIRALKARKLYFVDSLTTPRSAGYDLAKSMGMCSHKRDVFLDVFQEEEFIRSQFEKLLRLARFRGNAVGICHPYSGTIRILPKLFEEAETRGYQWVTVSQICREETGG